MTFNVLPFGSSPEAGNKSVAKPAPLDPMGTSSAEVVDLASRRDTKMRAPEVPDRVWEEVEAASRLWHELRAQDREVRFDADPVTGRVGVTLRDLDGGEVRQLRPSETFTIDDGPAGPSAA